MPALPCQTQPALFFAEAPAMLDAARSLCSSCDVQALCLAGAVERGEPHGVWGGQIFVGGTVVASKRGRGRPRRAA
ncbi:MAG: transcription factor WhiB [Marmoricola sp.]|nr:transcription factor WhiB [Marmoricola sp.]